MPRFARSASLAVGALLVLPGCGKVKEFLGEDPPPTPRPGKGKGEGKAEAPPDPGDGSSPLEPLTRAEKKLRFPGKSGEHMGFDLGRLSELQALAGAIEIPEWSQPGEGTARLVRDDDLRTAWVCQLGEGKACAVGIHFPEPAEAEAIRIFAATPSKGKFARPAVVRVHTDEGWAEARISDEDGLWNVQLGEGIRTRNLTVEVMEAHGDAPVHLAELEIFGRTGVPRPALAVDVSRRAVSFDTDVWKKKSRTYNAGVAFVEQVDVDGRLQRLVPGTALYGRTGDRLLLVEHASWSTCDDHQGTYSLLDTQTRVIVPLGDLGGFAGQAFVHAEGEGFALGRVDGDDALVQAVVIDKGHYERRSTTRLERRDPREMLASWNVTDTPISRADAEPVGEPPDGCAPAEASVLGALKSSLPKRTKLAPAQWTACSLGDGATLLVSTGGACGKQWTAAVVDGEGEVIEIESGKGSGSHQRLRRVDGETILVEQWDGKDRPLLLLADGGSLVRVKGTAGFSMRPPAGCRSRCDIELSDLGPAK